MVSRHIEIDVPCTFWFSFVFLWFSFSIIDIFFGFVYRPTHPHDRCYLISNTKGFFVFLSLFHMGNLFDIPGYIAYFIWAEEKNSGFLQYSLSSFFSFGMFHSHLSDVCFSISCSLVIFDLKCRIGLMVEPRERRMKEMRSIFQWKWIEITKFGYFIYTQTNKPNWVWDVEFMANGMR